MNPCANLAPVSLAVLLAATAAMAAKTTQKGRSRRRKILRMVGLCFPFAVYPLWGVWVFRYCLMLCSLVLALLETARFLGLKTGAAYEDVFGLFAKQGESRHVSGVTTYFWGALLASAAPGALGPAAMAMATMGDAWAALAGKVWGKPHTVRGKSMAGSTACLVSSFWAGATFFLLLGCFEPHLSALFAGAGALTAAEWLTSGKYDNITTHAAAALAMTALAGFPAT